MNWHIAFWFLAFVAMTSLAGLIVRAISHARRGDIERHRRTIAMALWVVVGFVASYGVKLATLGRENKSDWTRFDLAVLYTHEALVGTMLLCGGIGAVIGRGLFRARQDDGPQRSTPRRRQHHWLGRACAIAAVLALLTGGIVLYRMIARLG